MNDLTIEELADDLGVAVSTLQRYRRRGLPFIKGKGKAQTSKNYRYDPLAVAAWMQDNSLTGDVGKPITEMGMEMRAEQLRKIKAQANLYEQSLLTAQMEYDKQRDELLNKADVERGRIERILMVKKGLLSLGNSLSTQLEGLDAPTIAERIDAEVRRLLEFFSKQ